MGKEQVSRIDFNERLEPFRGENPFLNKDFVTIEGLTPDSLKYLFGLTDVMREAVDENEGIKLLEGRVVTLMFYEPSSRTFGSFLAAAERLGASVTPLQGMTYSSVAKWEVLEDTIRTFAGYSNAIVLRHPEEGSARIAAKATEKVVINAGDGAGEHPTQGLLDAYTIYRRFGRLSDLNIVVAGDVRNGRTIRSLLEILSKYPNNRVLSMAPEVLQMPSTQKARLENKGMLVQLDSDSHPDEVIGKADVWYHTRVQGERFAKNAMGELQVLVRQGFPELSEQQLETLQSGFRNLAQLIGEIRYGGSKLEYVITPEVMRHAKDDMVLMHPLPRVGEIDPAVDEDTRAIYFEQATNGMYVRMALLAAALGGVNTHV